MAIHKKATVNKTQQLKRGTGLTIWLALLVIQSALGIVLIMDLTNRPAVLARGLICPLGRQAGRFVGNMVVEALGSLRLRRYRGGDRDPWPGIDWYGLDGILRASSGGHHRLAAA